MVKKIINAKANGGISISPKETMNKLDKNFIKSKQIHYSKLERDYTKKLIELTI